MATQRKAARAADGHGVQLAPVLAEAVYPLELFRQITGLEAWAMREARRKGLRVIPVGRRRFVRGRDFLTYLDTQADNQSADRP